MTSNEDFLFAQEALAQGFVTDAQVEEGLLLQRRMAEDLKLDERLGVILVKRGYLAEDQARRVYARIQPDGGPSQIHGYRLLEVVGRGAMGTVYRALHLGLNREVAIKILRPDLAGDKTQIERLKAEAAMLASLDHPHIVRALDAGESNGFPYVVMEYVEGETLRDRLRREGPLAEPEALRIARCLADALERARRMGVVHRDVKPGNVLLTRAGAPKLMDLGLAKGPIDLGLTQHGATVGTPQYIAPEQALDPRKADTRSDIYALGATLYAMLTGQPPFDGHTLAEVLTKVLYEVPVPVRTLRPEVSQEAGYLVERMMLRDPSLRYRTPAQVVEDIDRLTQGTSILPQGFSGNWEAYLLRKRVRRTTVWVAGGVAALLLLAGGGWIYSGWKQRDRERAEVEARIRVTQWEVSPLEGSSQLRDRLARTDGLLRDAKEAGASHVAELEVLTDRLRDEIALFDRLDAVTKDRVKPALDAGDHATAMAALHEFTTKVPVYGPARRAAESRENDLSRASDDALASDRREKAFIPEPRDLEDLRAAAERWRDRTASRYAPTQIQREEHRAALDAYEASNRILTAARQAEATLSDEWLEKGIREMRFSALASDLAAAEAGAQAVERDEGPSLSSSERRFVLASKLKALVAQPFDARRRAVLDRVQQAWAKAANEARATSEAGDHPVALEILQRFAKSAAEGEAFPEIAQQARRAHDDLEARTRLEVEAAATALDTLAKGVVKDLRAADAAGLKARVAAASAQEALFRPVARSLADLSKVPPAWSSIADAVIAGISSHVGPEKEKWIDSLTFKGSPAKRNVEILEVRPEDRTVTLKTHLGGAVQGPFTFPLADLSEEDVFRLAGIVSGAPGDALRAAIHGLATLPIDADDFYTASQALQTVVERFERAGASSSPLSGWAVLERDRTEKEIAENEKAADEHLKSAREAMAARGYGEANYHFRTLVDRDREPTMRLPLTKVAKQHREYVEGQLNVILGLQNVESLELIWPGAKVTRRPSASADVLDVDVLFNFDSKIQLKNFTSGWARLAPPGQGRVLTPTEVTGRSLRLNPDGYGEVVRDRPLVFECPFDPAHEMSVTFWIWPETPIFFGIDLDGAQVGILSADPRSFPTFPPDVPLLERERLKPTFDFYGRGRGIVFRTGTDLGDPERWGWDERNQGRHFVPPDVDRPATREKLDTQWFAFEHRDKPYKVKFTRVPGQGVRLEVDEREKWSSTSAAMKAPRSSGLIQFLSFTPCVIDDLVLSGRIDNAWMERAKARDLSKPTRPKGVDKKR